ncbi:SRPBCC family protein [Trujillonella humicola]|uniref:SRPBCC family protein n=1 Tax=Trujillonella humicola TaxID=3383699 RepID=UPI00390655F5
MSWAVTHAVIEAAPHDVFAVLQDPATYPLWVIGARRLRRTEGNWPSVGATLHHELGALGVTVIRDVTVVRAAEPDTLLELEAKLRPVGVVVVRLRLTPIDVGTVVTMEERPVDGPVDQVHNPLITWGLQLRNRWALHRLARLARGRAAESSSGPGAARP